MDNSEARIREKTIKMLLAAMVVYFIFDIGYSLYYFQTREDIIFFRYMNYRIVLPNAINIICYIVVNIFCRMDSISNRSKNKILCFAMCTMGGGIAIIHGYFAGVWLLPAIMMVFSSIFGDRILRCLLLAYTFVLEGMCACQIIHEYPYNKVFYLQNLAIVICLTMLMFIIAAALEYHYKCLFEAREDLHRRELDYMSQISHDTLTGVYSRSYMMDLRKELTEKLKKSDNFVMAMVDIDDFKKVNDTYGHEKGDDVLRYMGNLFKKSMAENIRFSRYGGEEFVVLFENMPLEECRNFMDELRRKFEEKRFDFTEKAITFSCGLALAHKTDDFDDLLKRADAAMYESKNSGKNRITCKV